MDTEVTTPQQEDVAVEETLEAPGIENEQNEVEEGSTESTETTDADYDKAWENIDTNNPSDTLFGETNTPEDTPSDLEDQQVDNVVPQENVTQTGLMITNPILKYKGREIPIDNEEEAINLMQKGFKLESEMQKIKPYKQMISIMEDSSVTTEDLKALSDAIGGNEGAKKYIQNKLGVTSTTSEAGSFFDEVDENPAKDVDAYSPETPKVDAVAEIFANITEENPEVAGKVSQVYSDIDDQFKQEIYTKENFPMFIKSVASGEFDVVYPYAMKARAANPSLSWMNAYAMAGQKLRDNVVETKTETPGKGVGIPKGTPSNNRRTSTNDYDNAFAMDTKELEDKLFG